MDYQKAITTYNDMKYFEHDPVAVVRRCTEHNDIEIMGVICSWLAYGNRNQIFKHCTAAYDLMRGCPYQYLMSQEWRIFEGDKKCFYRLFSQHDFFSLLNVLYKVYSDYPNLQTAILSYCDENNCHYLDALIALLPTKGIPKNRTSACKRLSLFLRWMIRTDGIVDLGIWAGMDKKQLLIPLDVHVNRVARELSLLTRTASDMKAAQQLTVNCAQLYPDDPTIMDFALFGIGYTRK